MIASFNSILCVVFRIKKSLNKSPFVYKRKAFPSCIIITNEVFCYLFQGDSGSALLVGGQQVGIASFITDKCGIANEEHPNVYSKVAAYLDWIKETSKMKS